MYLHILRMEQLWFHAAGLRTSVCPETAGLPGHYRIDQTGTGKKMDISRSEDPQCQGYGGGSAQNADQPKAEAEVQRLRQLHPAQYQYRLFWKL